MEDLDKIQLELFNKSKEQQIKYVYYLVALSVSAIGYSIYRSVGHPFNALLILWALPLFSWSFSIYLGLFFLRKSIYNIDTDMKYIHLQKSIANNLEPDAKNIVLRMSIDVELEQSQNLKAERRYFKWQTQLFFLGILLFIIWHLTEIYISSKCYLI